MNKEELYKLALSDVVKYSLLNEIFAIRDKRVETVDYTIGVNGFISLDVLNDYVGVIQERDKYKSIVNKIEECIINFLCSEEYCGLDGIAIAKNYENLLKILKELEEGEDNESYR